MLATNPRSFSALAARAAQLTEENEKLKAQLAARESTSMFKLKDKTFQAATSFRNAQECLEEARSCGALAALSTLGRHEVPVGESFLEEQAQRLHAAMPGLSDEIDRAVALCMEARQKKPRKDDGRGRKTRVDVEHLFLIPFLYVVGGFDQWTGPMLDGIRVSQQQFSRLLAISMPVVVEHWAKQYYRPRGIEWLKKFCPPNAVEDEHGVDCTLFLDGSKYEVERSQGMREQRMTYSSVVESNVLQFIGVTNAQGWFVELSAWAGGHMKESDLVWKLELWDRLNEEAGARQDQFHVHLVVDRGFRDNRETLKEHQDEEDWPWPNLFITCEVVYHLGTKEEPTRSQHEPEEVETNRSIQARRWVNEKAFAFFDLSRFFQHTIEWTSIAGVAQLKVLAAAVANKKMKVPKND
jgi:hypothetical protein